MKTNCSICHMKNRDALIYSDELVLLWQNMDVNLPGYLIIAPKRHVEHYHKLTREEANALFELTARVTHILTTQFDARKIYHCCFSEMTPHIHFHLFPRYDGMDELPGIQTESGIDGPALFSYVRSTHGVTTEAQKEQLLKFIQKLRSIVAR